MLMAAESAAHPEGDEALGVWLRAADTARLAPSLDNSQPWRFHVAPGSLSVYEDTRRWLPEVDPEGRERVISCGAALLTARLCLTSAGVGSRLTVADDAVPPPEEIGVEGEDLRHLRLVGEIADRGAAAVSSHVARLVEMIPLRRTHVRMYRSHAIGEHDLLLLREAVEAGGARLTVLETVRRRRLADLLVSVAAPGRRPGGRRPVPLRSVADDEPALVLEADELARSTVLVISTRHDDRRDWVAAGMALQNLLLTATAQGLVAGFVDQALQSPAMRPRVGQALQLDGHPQCIVRIGRALQQAPATPRRDLSDLLVP